MVGGDGLTRSNESTTYLISKKTIIYLIRIDLVPIELNLKSINDLIRLNFVPLNRTESSLVEGIAKVVVRRSSKCK